MKKTFQWKVPRAFTYLFWLSPILIVMGLTAGVVSGGWTAIPVGLIATGVAIACLWLLTISGSLPGWWGKRSTQASTNAVVATIAIVVILGLLNLLAVRYSNRVDFTENQIFTLSEQTQQIVNDLRQPVKAMIFTVSPNDQDRQLLENYRRQNGNFSYEFVDPQAKPGVAREFGAQADGAVFLESGEQRQLVQTVTPEERLSERRLTNGLAQLFSNQQLKAYFVQGHGERSLTPGQGSISEAITELAGEGYIANPLNLTEGVPEDASVLVLAGSQRAFLEAEVEAIEEFLTRKSGLMLLIDPQTDPGLKPILDAWGIAFSDRIIIDPNGQAAGLGVAVPIVTQYGDHPITREFGNGISFFPLARPIEIRQVEGVAATPLLFTGPQTEAQRLQNDGQIEADPNAPRGSLPLGVALARPIAPPTGTPPSPAPEVSPEARIVAIGNSEFMTDGLLKQQLNQDVFLNSIAWLSQKDEQALSIRPKEMTNRRIILTPERQIAIVVLSVIFLPIVGFGMAIATWWRRR